jgi:hypothetical protein
MATKVKDDTRLGLYITDRKDTCRGGVDGWDYYHVQATVVTLGMTAEERRYLSAVDDTPRIPYDRIRNVGDLLIRGLWLQNLMVTSQLDSKSTLSYGWQVRYHDVYAVDERMARHMAQTLTTIRKRMEHATAKYGRPTTYGQFVARVAQAIGATAFVRQTGEWRGSSYSDNTHDFMDIPEGITHVDQLEATWLKAHAAQKATA